MCIYISTTSPTFPHFYHDTRPPPLFFESVELTYYDGNGEIETRRRYTTRKLPSLLKKAMYISKLDVKNASPEGKKEKKITEFVRLYIYGQERRRIMHASYQVMEREQKESEKKKNVNGKTLLQYKQIGM